MLHISTPAAGAEIPQNDLDLVEFISNFNYLSDADLERNLEDRENWPASGSRIRYYRTENVELYQFVTARAVHGRDADRPPAATT